MILLFLILTPNPIITRKLLKKFPLYHNHSPIYLQKYIIPSPLHILFLGYFLMKLLKRCTIIGIVFVIIMGSLFHFLYDWSGHNHIVGLFTPVNESVWEHMKLLFFPMLFYSLIMILQFRKKYPYIASSLFFGVLTGTLLIPLFYYAYTCILGRNFLILDIGIFILSIVISFWLTYKLTLSHRLKSHTFVLGLSVCVLWDCFLLFTYHAPNSVIFQDPTAINTYSDIFKASPSNSYFQMLSTQLYFLL